MQQTPTETKAMQSTRETETETKPPICGTAEGDGETLRLFLAEEVVRIAAQRGLAVAQVAEDNGLTEGELRRLLRGGDEADLWRLFALLRQLGAAMVVGVESDPVPAAKGVVMWTRLDLSSAAVDRAKPD
ncbi:hypothetical protein QA640_42495 [Bradyrhizobium sp. CB82]|uniref:hypothetical protein n=1 Tax=Bradyrhizobium sp. CB82 TaxID=3039159 RepID=UPI0024B0BE5D|nr:hypothetical protein [Bradyrhizobium sp. CB82]WFU40754.1 hypothetical protein QA640_42495 [Bradyrhizobium sp. CB82]